MANFIIEVDKFLKEKALDPALVMHIDVSSEELLKNIISHGFLNDGGRHYIDYRLSVLAGKVCIVISDKSCSPHSVSPKDRSAVSLLS